MDSESIYTLLNSLPTEAEILRTATILDEGIKLCPKCTSELRFFYINYNKKLQMCVNVECDYPFGQENLVCVKVNDGYESGEEVPIIGRAQTSSQAHSEISTAAWSEIAKVVGVKNPEKQIDGKTETRDYTHKAKSSRKEVAPVDTERTQLLQQLHNLHDKDVALSKETDFISNPKWIENLMKLQKGSGKTLLTDEEIRMYERSKPNIGLGALQIDIGMGAEKHISTIKIQIANTKDT